MRQFSRRWALWFLLFAFCAAGLRPACAQTVTVLHSFGDGGVANDGAAPVAPLLLGADGNFYATTEEGGSTVSSDPFHKGYGTVFKMTPGGVETVLFNFDDGLFNLDTNPVASLVFGLDGNLYGTTVAGGTSKLTDPSGVGYGAVFQMTTTGQLTTIHDFSDGNVAGDGKKSAAALIMGSDGNFYGTTAYGGTANGGTVFTITPAGAITILHNFGDGSVANDGLAPVTSLLQADDGTYYGTTEYGGTGSGGTIFKITSAGAVTVMHSFGDGSVANDGLDPVASLIQGRDGNFYGTTEYGGTATFGANFGSGTAYKMTTDGTVTILHSFNDGSVAHDALYPVASLLQAPDGNFYGTTVEGGSSNDGALFEITSAGTVTILHSFGDGSVLNDGFFPQASLSQGGDDNLYGTTMDGGVMDKGTIFQYIPAPPQNDDIANAISISAAPGTPGGATGTNFGATSQSGEPANTSASGGHSVWWTWTAPDTGTATIDTFGSDFDTTLGVYTGSAVNALTQVAANDDAGGTTQSSVTFNAVAGTKYSILVDGYELNEGDIVLHVAETVAAPANDNFASRFTINAAPGAPGTATGTNFGATSQSGEPANTSASGGHSVWWKWTASVSGSVTIDTLGSSYDTTLGIYTGSAVNALTQIASNDDISSGVRQSSVTFSAVAGTTYQISVDGYGSNQGSVTLHVTQTYPTPAITSFTPASGPVGTVVTINGTNFTGATSVKFHGTSATSFMVGSATSITATVPTGATTGTVSVTTPGGTATSSSSFTVTSSLPTISSINPTSGPIGTTVTINGTNFTGATKVRFHNATATTYTVNSATKITVTVPTGAGTGTITVTTPAGAVTSSQTFTVIPAPTITSFTPTSAHVGTLVTITGTGLSGVSKVRFHNASAVTYSVNGAGTQITVTVPSGAATGTITVTTPGGSVTSAGTITIS